jgi:hypothetical protein
MYDEPYFSYPILASSAKSAMSTPAQDYKHDVFLSYRRSYEWPRFVNKIFVPMLRHFLGLEIGRDPEIFYDAEQIEIGQSWPNATQPKLILVLGCVAPRGSAWWPA